jgi:phage tail-like protein
MAQTGVPADPYRNYNFLVEIDGIAQASFMECSGLDATTEIVEYREGGDNTTVRKLPGKTTYGDITLKGGLTDSKEIWAWRKQVIQGNVQRKNGSIVAFDLANSKEVARWNFVRGWPSKWEGPHWDARGKDIAVETLTIAHEGIERA